MAAPDDADDDTGVTLRLVGDGRPSFRDGLGVDRVVSVLFGTDIEAWRSGWNRTPAGPPAREAVIDVSDVIRSGATASTQVVPDRQFAYTVLGGVSDADRVLDAVAEHFDGAPSGTVGLVIDDVGAVTERGIDAPATLVDRLVDRFGARASGIEIGCRVDVGDATLLSRLRPCADRVVGSSSEATAAVERLRRTDPTTFGYLRRHWGEAHRGIEACDRNYPQSKQVHAALADPETTPRTLGAALSGLVALDALDTWRETVGPTRYDLTGYRPDRTWAVGSALEATVVSDD